MKTPQPPDDTHPQPPDTKSEQRMSETNGKAAAAESLKPILETAQVTAEHAASNVISRGRSKGTVANFSNAALLIKSLAGLQGRFSFDEFTRTIMVNHELDGQGWNGKRLDEPKPLQEKDIISLHYQLQTMNNGMPSISKAAVYEAIEYVAYERPYHPIKQWFDTLQWDGTPRLLLPTYFGTRDDPYHRETGRMFLLSMVARIYEPGCKVDYMLVFEMEQGMRKSTACRVLAGGDRYFSDNLPPLDHKDSSIHLRDKWLIEIAELHTFSRVQDQALLKSFLTRQVERYRPPHAIAEVIEPRHCVYTGTTNKGTYLKDETGGRRFWPVRTGRIDVEALEHDRAQLFAEALEQYEGNNWQWWPTFEFEQEHIRPQQEERYEEDAWEEKIGDWLNTPQPCKACAACLQNRAHPGTVPMECTSLQVPTTTTINEVAKQALEIGKSILGDSTAARLSRADQLRIAAALTHLGWERGKRTMHVKPWVRSKNDRG